VWKTESRCSVGGEFDSAVIAAEYAAERRPLRFSEYAGERTVEVVKVDVQAIVELGNQRKFAARANQYLEPQAPGSVQIGRDPVAAGLGNEK
jgi:hypothetical protein